MMTWTRAVIVTPKATAATIDRKKIAPKSVTQPVLVAALSEKSPMAAWPAGNVAATMKMDEQTISDQPAIYPRAGCSPRRTHA